MSVHASENSLVLVVMAGECACAFPVQHVAETMRPLPIEPLAGTPAFVRGVAVIRGAPTPVIDLKALLKNGENSAIYGRFVTLKLGDRRVALGVDSVVGLKNLNAAQLADLPPMLRDVATDLISAVSTREAQLLLVLQASRLVPDEVWAGLATAEARQ